MLCFAILQLFMISVGQSTLKLFFNGMLTVSGEVNLTKDNIWTILQHPIALLLAIGYIVLLSLFILIEFTCLFLAMDMPSTKRSWKQLRQHAMDMLHQTIRLDAVYLIVYFLLLVPIVNVSFRSMITNKVKLPDFILGELTKTTHGMLIYWCIVIVFIYINARLLHILPLTILKKQSFLERLHDSWRATRKKVGSLLLATVLLELMLFIAYVSIFFVCSLIVIAIDPDSQSITIQTLYYAFLRGLAFLYEAISKLALLSLSYVSMKQAQSSTISYTRSRFEKKAFISLVVLAGSVLLYYFSTYKIQLQNLSLNPHTQLIAHRGDITGGVENSIEALEVAAQKGADFVEMDVLLTKDHQFVVVHDNKLKRLARIPNTVATSNADDIIGVPIYQGEWTSHLSSFEEYVAKAKELHVNLLIEIKLHGQEPDTLAELFAQKMKELELDQSDYRVMSIDLETIEKVRPLLPSLKIGHVIPIQFGLFSTHPAIDFYVIESYSYNDFLVTQIQQEGKEVYVWTINDEVDMMRFLQRSANGIITDELDLFITQKQLLHTATSYMDKVGRLLELSLYY